MPTEWSDDILLSDLADEPALSEEINAVVARLHREGEVVPNVVLNADVTYLNSSNIAHCSRARDRASVSARRARSRFGLATLPGDRADKVFVFA